MTISNQNFQTASVGGVRGFHPPSAGRRIPPVWVMIVPVIAVAGVVAAVFSARPFFGVVAVLALCAVGALAAFYDAVPGMFLKFLAVVLIGYAFFGRGFAYIGVPPLFIGEITLAFGLIAALTSGALLRLARSPIAWVMAALALLGLSGTIPYYQTFGLDALRDATLWGYGAFAFIVAACVLGSNSFPTVVRRYGGIVAPFAAWVPLLIIAGRTIGEALGTMPGTDVPILTPKQGDAGVHLAGAAAFVLLGLNSRINGVEPEGWRRPRVFWVLWMLAMLCVASLNRGGLLSAMTALFVLGAFKPVSIGKRIGVTLAGIALATAALLVVVNLDRTFEVAAVSEERSVSPRQIVENVRSLVGLESRAASFNLSSTSGWRLDWWKAIAGYTLNGPYFWTGKGFGVNLADDDGFQVSREGEAPLRSPHNAHMTILARMGVPGLVLWAMLQACFAGSLLLAYIRALRSGQDWWARIDLWILIYWIAFIVNASFDVFLEGPQGGIWYWCLIGFGIAALESQRALARARWAPVSR
jgi:hypothetical protein